MKTQEKRPSDALLIVLSYTKRLSTTDSILTSNWTTPSGLEINEAKMGIIGTHYTWAILEQGTAQEFYRITNIITTSQGETKHTVVPIFVRDEATAVLT